MTEPSDFVRGGEYRDGLSGSWTGRPPLRPRLFFPELYSLSVADQAMPSFFFLLSSLQPVVLPRPALSAVVLAPFFSHLEVLFHLFNYNPSLQKEIQEGAREKRAAFAASRSQNKSMKRGKKVQ